MIKKTLKALGFVLLGVLGGMIWQTILIPYLAEQPKTSDLWFVENYRNREINLYPQEETIITQNESLVEKVKEVQKSLVVIKAKNSYQWTMGFIYTSDGLIIAPSGIPRGSLIVQAGGEEKEAELIKRDVSKSLSLLKIEGNYSTFGFRDKPQIGERVFVLGSVFGGGVVFNDGSIRKEGEMIYTNIKEENYMEGSVLFDREGKVLGLNKINLDGEVIAIPGSVIRRFVEGS